MDRLIVMKTFVTVGKASSFAGAARELGISGSLVSRHVADLERQVGVRLVHRTARSVSLTGPGKDYCDFAERILGEIEGKDRELSHSQEVEEGTLSIICPKWVGAQELGDAMAAFSAAHPKISVRFHMDEMSDRVYDFLDRGYDVAFYAKELRDSSLMLRKISDLPFVLAASREYLDAHGRPTGLDDLQHHSCLVNAEDPVWRLGADPDQVQYRVINTELTANSSVLIEKMVSAGCGIGLIPLRAARAGLELGDLELVLEGMQPPARALYALHAPGGHTPQRVRTFLRFMIEWFRANQAQPPVLPTQVGYAA